MTKKEQYFVSDIKWGVAAAFICGGIKLAIDWLNKKVEAMENEENR